MKKAHGTDTSRTRDSGQTRERILTAARARFSQHSYESVGTRDVAGDAGVDAALVNRYFGSKEKLFAEVIEGGFHVEEHLPEHLDDLGTYLVAQVLDDADSTEPAPFDALRVLLHATGNPAIAAMVSARFHAEFVTPLARLLRGRDAEVRAALIASYVIGLATMRHGLNSPVLAGPSQRKAAVIVAKAIQACVD
ncbi:MAG: TetR family transcriptional regulator [Rhodanobacter sp.]